MSKLINVSDELYKKLTELKKKNESYTLVIKNLLEEKTNKEEILKFAGTAEFDEEKLKDLRRGWKRWSEKYA